MGLTKMHFLAKCLANLVSDREAGRVKSFPAYLDYVLDRKFYSRRMLVAIIYPMSSSNPENGRRR